MVLGCGFIFKHLNNISYRLEIFVAIPCCGFEHCTFCPFVPCINVNILFWLLVVFHRPFNISTKPFFKWVVTHIENKTARIILPRRIIPGRKTAAEYFIRYVRYEFPRINPVLYIHYMHCGIEIEPFDVFGLWNRSHDSVRRKLNQTFQTVLLRIGEANSICA